MIEHDVWWPGVCRGLAGDLAVYVLAANAGAELPAGCFAHVDDWAPDPTTGCMTFPPHGWADWYAAAEELP